MCLDDLGCEPDLQPACPKRPVNAGHVSVLHNALQTLRDLPLFWDEKIQSVPDGYSQVKPTFLIHCTSFFTQKYIILWQKNGL